ncbi:hypothetical protein [Pedobacter ginsengisoli]|uniref:hypothetical protein n=1 Tax=Pedobacter ginsengisoli TaxID=363852 RepID=UPI00254A39B5|nr:hypothetical protein [Pedobacter ginsengisoli]
MRSLLFLTIACLLCTTGLAQVRPLSNAHAHNDYEHKRPLLDALGFGFTSVEADIYLIGNELYVSHNYPKELKGITLKELYLDPLQAILQKNKNKVYPGYNGVFYLMIDLKSDGVTTYNKLHELVSKYPEFKKNPNFTIFLSGKDLTYTFKMEDRIMAADGRPKDIGAGYAISEMPVISESFSTVTGWKGKAEPSEAEWGKAEAFINAVHMDGRKCRLWASPDNEAAWTRFLGYKMDFINTDKLKELAEFLGRTR